MIDKTDIIEKLGKKGFVDFVSNNRSNQPTGYDRTKGIRGRVRWRRCEHGVWIIKDYKPMACEACQVTPKNTKAKDFKPYFNIGLGAFVESRSEEKRIAKQKGYEEAGYFENRLLIAMNFLVLITVIIATLLLSGVGYW